MKVAQILSTIPDELPKEYADELAVLQADAPAMGWLFVKRRMRSELEMNGKKNLKVLIRMRIQLLLLVRSIKQDITTKN